MKKISEIFKTNRQFNKMNILGKLKPEKAFPQPKVFHPKINFYSI